MAAISLSVIPSLSSVVAAQTAAPVNLSSLGEDALLERLRDADPNDAAALERELQAVWSSSGSPSMDLLLRRGRDAMERQDWAAAIEHLTALTDHAPQFAEGWSERARAFFNAERYGSSGCGSGTGVGLEPE